MSGGQEGRELERGKQKTLQSDAWGGDGNIEKRGGGERAEREITEKRNEGETITNQSDCLVMEHCKKCISMVLKKLQNKTTHTQVTIATTLDWLTCTNEECM